MEQRALKNVKSCLNTKISFYMETSGGQNFNLYLNVVHFINTSGLHYKFMTILNDDARVINKLEALLTDDASVVIYDHHMFIVQATVLIRHLWQFSYLGA